MSEVTQILQAIDDGDAQATEKLFPLVYDELRRLAAQKLAQENGSATLQPTALVHESYLRLVGHEHSRCDSRGHFFAAAAEAMRRILIDRARRKNRQKRGGGRRPLHLKDIHALNMVDESHFDELLALDEALVKLEAQDPLKAQLIKLRFYAGLTGQQAADSLGISRATADRHWSFARAWLYHEITK